MEKPQETTGVGTQVGWDRVSGNHQGRAVIARLMETQTRGEVSAKEQQPLPALLCGKKLPLQPSFSRHIILFLPIFPGAL